jgi:hypothetical protein
VCTRGSNRALLGGASTSPLEVAMYCRDVQILQAPTRRLRWLRLIANTGMGILLLTSTVGVLALLIRGPHTDLSSPWWAAFAILPLFFLAWVGGMVNLLVFRIYRMRCPCCDEPWAPKFAVLIDTRCHNCGYDCTTGHREGDF